MADPVSTDLNAKLGGHDKNDFIQKWRGIAVFVVIYYHFSNRVSPEALGATDAPLISFYTGKVGVMAFFIISAYLITKSLFSSKNLGSFYSKRLSRIWPPFILTAVVVFFFLQIFAPPQVLTGEKTFFTEPRNWFDLLTTIFFLGDLGNWVDGVYWSIAVEVKFYFLIGLLCWARPRDFVKWFAIAAFLLSSMEMLLSLSQAPHAATINKILNGLFIAQHAPYFAIGALLFDRRFSNLLTLNLIAGMAFLLLKSAENPDFQVVGTVIFSIALALFIGLDSLLLKGRIFRAMGDYSYTWYLVHQMIGLVMIQGLIPYMGFNLAILVALLATFGLSMLLSWAAEWRFRNITYEWLMKVMRLVGFDRMTLRSRTEMIEEPAIGAQPKLAG